MCYVGFYGNKEIISHLFQSGFPNGLFIAVSRHRLMTCFFTDFGGLKCEVAICYQLIT